MDRFCCHAGFKQREPCGRWKIQSSFGPRASQCCFWEARCDFFTHLIAATTSRGAEVHLHLGGRTTGNVAEVLERSNGHAAGRATPT